MSECRVQTTNLILTLEALVLFARRERMVGRLVAKLKLRRLGHCVVVGIPLEQDGITDGCVEHGWHIAEDTLRRSNYDGVGCASPIARSRRGGIRRGGIQSHARGRRGAKLSNTF